MESDTDEPSCLSQYRTLCDGTEFSSRASWKDGEEEEEEGGGRRGGGFRAGHPVDWKRGWGGGGRERGKGICAIHWLPLLAS